MEIRVYVKDRKNKQKENWEKSTTQSRTENKHKQNKSKNIIERTVENEEEEETSKSSVCVSF